MGTTTTNGTTTSFTNTPQAKDDSFSFSEDAFLSAGSITLDVMGNDLGGKAKTLWSLDGVDATESGTTAETLQDLLAKTTGTVQSNHGATIKIENGQVIYTPTAAMLTALQALNVNDTYQDTFTYAIKLANGTLSWATANVYFSGSNDAAVITGDTSGSANETNAAVTITGELTATDVDNDDGFQAETIVGTHGSLSINTTGAWNFTANSAFDYLNVGDEVSETFTVKSVDGTEQVIEVNINGTNDAAVITGDTSGTTDETNAAVTITGALTATDVDNAAGFQAEAIVGTSGSLSIDVLGAWSFTANSAFDELNVGGSVSEMFTVKSVDGTEQTIEVTINGTNDAALISGTATGSVTEDATLTTTGTLTVTDVDNTDNLFTTSAATTVYGSYTMSDAGVWVYSLDNSNTAVQALNTTQTLNDSFTVTSVDGTSQTVTVTINGANEPVIVTTPTPATAPDTYNGADPYDFDNGISVYNNSGDVIYGGVGDDPINAGNGSDTVYGGSGNDTINGENGVDYLYGGSGNDTILGDDSPDMIYGGYGADTLTGNNGKDTFVYWSVLDTNDTIKDFSQADHEKIDLSAIDANPTTTLNDGFIYSGNANLQANSVSWFQQDGNTIIQADTDGNATTAELQITLTGNIALQATDFYL